MKTSDIVRKAAYFFALVSAVFVAVSAVATYDNLRLALQGAPTEYIAINVLTATLPYLFLMVLSLVVALVSQDKGEAPPMEEPKAEETTEKTDEEANF